MFKTLDSFNFKGKRVLVRIDVNSEVKNNKIVPSDRIKASAETIKELLKKKAKVVVLAHQGRPGKEDFTSLKQHAQFLNKYVKMKFVKDIIGSKALSEIRKIKEGEALLLENVRFLKEELVPSNNKLVKTLALLFDYYVNDAFSVSHREQTSITEFPKVLPSCMGRTMENELKHLSKINIKNCLFILGGDKPEDTVLLLKNKNILASGVLANICLSLKCYKLGAEDKIVNEHKETFSEIKRNMSHIKLPVDLALNVNGKRKEVNLNGLPSKYLIFDIGSKTIKDYEKEIANAKSIFFKGTPGFAEKKGFEKGTKSLLKAIEKSKAFSIVSGGHSITALDLFRINKKRIGYVSLSGGATVHYLAGKKLPGLEALK